MIQLVHCSSEFDLKGLPHTAQFLHTLFCPFVPSIIHGHLPALYCWQSLWQHLQAAKRKRQKQKGKKKSIKYLTSIQHKAKLKASVFRYSVKHSGTTCSRNISLHFNLIVKRLNWWICLFASQWLSSQNYFRVTRVQATVLLRIDVS